MQYMWKSFTVLRNRNYCLYWLAEFPYYFSMFSSQLAQGWIVYNLTQSAFLLGLMTAVTGVPQVIIALYGGVLADRVKKQQLLFYVQAVLGLDALFLAISMAIGIVEYWHVVVYAVIWRTAMTFGLPARLAFISEITNQNEFSNAYALYYVALNLLGVIGPALAGGLIAQIGVSGVLFVIAFCQWIFNAFLFQITPTSNDSHDNEMMHIEQSLMKDIYELLRFALHDIMLLTLISVKIALAFLAMPAITLMPAFSTEVLGIDAVGFGILQATGGVGSFLGSLVIMSTSNMQRKPLLLLIACIVRGIALLLFALSNTLSLALLFRLVIGISTSTYVMTNSVLFQLSAADHIRGRIMGLYMISFDFVGPIPLSILAEEAGVATAIGLGGVLLLVITIMLFLFIPAFRNRRM
jgi:MFS family permease